MTSMLYMYFRSDDTNDEARPSKIVVLNCASTRGFSATAGLLVLLCQYELIYTVFGRSNFERTTANLDLFLRRFNEVQYWVVTEMCLAQSMSKRVQLLRKFIKIAA